MEIVEVQTGQALEALVALVLDIERSEVLALGRVC